MNKTEHTRKLMNLVETKVVTQKPTINESNTEFEQLVQDTIMESKDVFDSIYHKLFSRGLKMDEKRMTPIIRAISKYITKLDRLV